MKIYNSQGRVVYDEYYTANIKPTYDSMSVLWKVGSENGCIMSEGAYRAELVLEDSGVFVYDFRLTSDRIPQGFKCSAFRLFAKLEKAFDLPRGSISYGLSIAAIAIVTVGGILLLNHFCPGWMDFLNKPATEWFK